MDTYRDYDRVKKQGGASNKNTSTVCDAMIGSGGSQSGRRLTSESKRSENPFWLMNGESLLVGKNSMWPCSIGSIRSAHCQVQYTQSIASCAPLSFMVISYFIAIYICRFLTSVCGAYVLGRTELLIHSFFFTWRKFKLKCKTRSQSTCKISRADSEPLTLNPNALDWQSSVRFPYFEAVLRWHIL